VFFFLSKTLDLLLAPLTWALLGIAFGALQLLLPRTPRRARLGAAALLLSLFGLWAFSTAWLANRIFHRLESSARSTIRPGVTYDAVILLGGMVQVYASEPGARRSYNDNNERLLAAFELLRGGQARQVLVTGGGEGVTSREARVLRDQLIDWGIESERIVIDDRSRNTRDNAVESARIAKEKGWTQLVMVTSAFHMQRAAGCFAAVGLPVDLLPVDQRSADPSKHSGGWQPRADALAQSTGALRELAGQLVYKLRGYSK
jgi:uncharacterized SAM-binding protein YcdF (DUF218 family)